MLSRIVGITIGTIIIIIVVRKEIINNRIIQINERRELLIKNVINLKNEYENDIQNSEIITDKKTLPLTKEMIDLRREKLKKIKEFLNYDQIEYGKITTHTKKNKLLKLYNQYLIIIASELKDIDPNTISGWEEFMETVEEMKNIKNDHEKMLRQKKLSEKGEFCEQNRKTLLNAIVDKKRKIEKDISEILST